MSFLKGVYWDLDGTIANTELEAHLPAFNKAFDYYHLGWNWGSSCYVDLLKINGGKNRIAFYSKINNFSISEDLISKIHKKKQYYYLELIKNNTISLKVGVYRLTQELFNKNVRQFIVTSSSRKQVELLVNHLFPEFNPFEFIISSDDVKFCKPNPFPYLKAMKLSGINKFNSIVFEDSNAGLKASLAANLPTIYIPSNLPISLDSDINPNCIIDNLGNENNLANVIKGPKIDNKFIDYSFLERFLMIESNAED